MTDLEHDNRYKEFRGKRPHLVGSHSYKTLRKSKFMGTESRLVVTGGRGGTRIKSKWAQGTYWEMTMF